MITREQVLSIGTVTRAFGKQGALLCRTTNEYWEQSSSSWLILSLDHILVPFRVNDWYTKGTDGIVFTLQDITTEQQTQPLLGVEAFMLRSDLSETDENAIAWTDLVGYTVIDTDQGPLGTITSIDDTTANILATLLPYSSTPLPLYYARETLFLLASVYFIVIGIRGGFGRYTRPITISNAMQYVNTPRECALVLNTPFTMIQSIVPARFEEKHYFTDDELPQHMNPVHSPVPP